MAPSSLLRTRRTLWAPFLALCLAASAALPLPAMAEALDDAIKAATLGDKSDLIDLLRRGVEVDSSDANGNTLLALAARQGNSELVTLLLKARANPAIANRYGEDALLLAAYHGHLAVVKQLVLAGVDINRAKGWTPLGYAAFQGREEVADYLLDQGADVNVALDNGTTPLMLAARNGHLGLVKLLLEYKADTTLRNDAGLSAKDWALRAKNTDIADLIDQAGRQHKH